MWYVFKQVYVIETGLQVGQQFQKMANPILKDNKRPGAPRAASREARLG